MPENSGSATAVGVLTGILFTAAAMIPNSHAYPLIVPFLGGALAAYLAGRMAPAGAGGGAKAGAKAGAIGGLIFLLVAPPLIYLLVGSVIREQLRTSGLNLPLDGFLPLLLALFIVAVIGFVLAVIGGLLAGLLTGRR